MIVTDRWREPTGKKVYVPTGKEPGWTYGEYGDPPWILAKAIEDKLGPDGGTLAEIYHQIGAPLHLSLDDTKHLLRRAQDEGYVK